MTFRDQPLLHHEGPPRRQETTPRDIPSPSMPSDMQPFIWQQLGEIQKCLGRLEAGQDDIKGRLEKVEEKTSKTSEKLSRILWIGAGAGAVIGILVSIATSLLKYLPK
ncbi:hypothetical protein FMZ60_09055 [Alcaligenaceae bacterium SJ-26]|nr:hypothetical protein FMZ60_09055 [Alcaligenaceae bacterium SJ-26]